MLPFEKQLEHKLNHEEKEQIQETLAIFHKSSMINHHHQ